MFLASVSGLLFTFVTKCAGATGTSGPRTVDVSSRKSSEMEFRNDEVERKSNFLMYFFRRGAETNLMREIFRCESFTTSYFRNWDSGEKNIELCFRFHDRKSK